MERATRVEQRAPISHGWDLLSRKRVLCGRAAARGKALADILSPAPAPRTHPGLLRPHGLRMPGFLMSFNK